MSDHRDPQREDAIVASDREFFRTSAQRCYGLARQAADEGAVRTLMDLGRGFDQTAWHATADEVSARRLSESDHVLQSLLDAFEAEARARAPPSASGDAAPRRPSAGRIIGVVVASAAVAVATYLHLLGFSRLAAALQALLGGSH